MDNQDRNIVINVVNNTPVRRGNGMGVAGFVFSLLTLFLCWVPYVAAVFWLLALIFSIVGVCRRPRGLAIAGLVITVIDLALLLFVIAAVASVASGVFGQFL